MLQRCASCGLVWLPPAPACPRCLRARTEWVEASGLGRVTSWVVYRKVYYGAFAGEIPYHVAQVELDEGPRLTTHLVGVANDAIRAGMRVRVTFEDVTAEMSLPRFRPEEMKED